LYNCETSSADKALLNIIGKSIIQSNHHQVQLSQFHNLVLHQIAVTVYATEELNTQSTYKLAVVHTKVIVINSHIFVFATQVNDLYVLEASYICHLVLLAITNLQTQLSNNILLAAGQF
jgi:hypothetical protein